VPRAVGWRTRHELALEMLDTHHTLLPHGWVAGDDEMGRSTRFRRALAARQQRYLLAVPSNTLVRDLDAAPPPYAGSGRYPQVPFVRGDRWVAALPAARWTPLTVRPGEKGPLVVEAVRARVQAKTERRRAGPEETLVVLRERQGDGSFKHDYYLSNASAETPLLEFARVAKAEHRIEECLQRAKGEAGLADYEVRTWRGWHHHQTLSLLAAWFLTQEARRGKKKHASIDGSASALGDRAAAAPSAGVRPTGAALPHQHASSAAERASAPVPLEASQPLGSTQSQSMGIRTQ
jgi:SRSO17 transposase